MKSKLLLGLAAYACLVQSVSAQVATQPGSGAESGNAGEACPRFANRDWPVHLTILARVTSLMDPAHLKPGKEVFAKVVYPIAYEDCALDDDAILYGHVTAASSSKNPDSSELGLVFDHADCRGHLKQEVHLRMIGLVAPPERGTMLHDVLPSEVAGGVQGLPSTSADGIDDNLTASRFPPTIHPGLVVRMPKVTLEPEGAPGCSAKISSAERSVQVVPGSALIFTLQRTAKPGR